MKYLVLIANGLTDEPIAEKDNKTPLQLSQTPNLDFLAQKGLTGSVYPIPESLHAGNDVSYLSLLGLDPEQHLAGVAGFEAFRLGVDVENDEIPLCCDFISLQSSHNDLVMKDYTAGNLSDADAGVLLAALQDQVVESKVRFHPGTGHHHLMILKSPPIPAALIPPFELVGEGMRKFMPQDDSCKELVHIINQAQVILHNHPLNKQRQQNGSDSVNSIWLWGNGPIRSLPSFFDRYKLKGSLVSGSLLFQGMARSSGMNLVSVDGATGSMDTNFKGKVDAALKELQEQDVVYLHIAGAEEASLHGNIDDKILALEDFDHEVLRPVLQEMEVRNDVKMLLTQNQVCSVNLMKYKKDPVPFAVYPANRNNGGTQHFDEGILETGSWNFKSGTELMDAFFKGEL